MRKIKMFEIICNQRHFESAQITLENILFQCLEENRKHCILLNCWYELENNFIFEFFTSILPLKLHKNYFHDS